MPDGAVGRWSAGPAAHGPGGPPAAGDAGVPAQDRLRGDQQPQALAACFRDHAGQGCGQGPVRPVQVRAARLPPLPYGELVGQDQDPCGRPCLLDTVLADAGIRTVLCSIQAPRMNAIVERWIGGCRRELLDRTLVWNPAHLRRILRQYEIHHNQHRPHRSLHGAAPLKPLPEPVDLDLYRVRKQTHVDGLINEYHLVA